MSGFTDSFSSDAVRAGPSPRRWSPALFRCVRTPSGGRRGGLDRLDPDALLALGGVLELDLAGHGGEHGVIAAEAGPLAGEEGHPALADDDRPGRDELDVAGLYAQ